MSTATPSVPQKVDFDAVILRRLESFSRRRRRLLICRALLAAVAVFVVAMLIVGLCDYLWFLTQPVRWTLSVLGYVTAGIAAWWYGLRELTQSDPRTIARQIESVDPRLREDLLSAVELAEPDEMNGSPIFLERLKRTVARQVATIDPRRLLPVGLLRRWLWVATALVVGVLLLSLIPSLQFGKRMARAMLPGIPVQRVSRTEIRIVAPAPASRDVAQGDAVGVVVETSGQSVDEVVLQWYTDEGDSGEAVMTRRETAEFSANLPIGSVPVDYRIRGGDCMTLWERLTPQPRPRVESFEVRYRFPKYSLLDDEVTTTDHGDLRALVGTIAEIIVTFDQSVDDAVMRFDGGRYEARLDSLDNNGVKHRVELPIRSPATYNVDSVSRSSGLSNPFSPRYSITPITDTPPVARWGDAIPQSQLVAPLEIVKLSASVVDDLPLDTVKQLFQINSGEWHSRDVEVESPARELELAWSWDLTELEAWLPKMIKAEDDPSSQSTVSLSPGDIIRTRIVVQDRRDQSGESRTIELLIADQGFAKNRHDPLRELARYVTQLSEWLETVKPLAKLAIESEKQPPADYFNSVSTSMAPIREPLTRLRRELSPLLAKARTPNDAGLLHQLGLALVELDRRFSVASAMASRSDTDASDPTNASTIVEWKEFVRESRELESLVNQTQQFAAAIVGHEMTLAVTADANSLLTSLQPLANLDEPIPDERWPRYLSIAVERMRDIERLVEEQKLAMPQSTYQQLSRWVEWSESWESRLQLAIDDFPGAKNAQGQTSSFQNELRDRITYGIFDGQLANSIRDLSDRYSQSTISSHASLVEQLKRFGSEIERSQKDSEREKDSKKAAAALRKNREAKAWFAAHSQGLGDRLEGAETVERDLAIADLRFAADLSLARRAIKNVTGDGFTAYKDIAAEQVHREISQAIGRLEGVHLLVETQRELITLLDAQSRVGNDAASRLGHPLWFEQIQLSIQSAERVMQQSGVSRELIQPFAALRHDDDANRAATQLSERRYTKAPLVPVILPLRATSEKLASSILSLGPLTEEARQTLLKFVLTLPEQARAAAKRAEEAEQAIRERPDSTPPTEESLRTPHQSAEEATRETIRALVDLANTRDLHDAEDRELARDADVAAAQLNESSREAEDAMQFAKAAMSDDERAQALEQAAESLAAMKEQLQQTAEHFENALAGKDVEESRAELRGAEEALELSELLDKRYQDAANMAERTSSDPAEMLKALERELNRNEPMQEKLDDIADQSAEAAQRLLSRAANEEAAMRTSLERSDSVFDEQKQRIRNELRGAAKRIADVDRALMNATERAVGWNQPRKETDEIRATREKLSQVAQQAERIDSGAPLAEVKETTKQLADAVDAARQWTEKLNERSQAKTDDDVHDSDRSRNDAKRQLEQIDRQTRDQRVRDVQNQINAWNQTKNEVGRRIQDAQRQERDAKNRIQQHEGRLKKDPDNPSLKQEINHERQRAELAVEAAKEGQRTRTAVEEKEKKLQQRKGEIEKSALADLSDVANPAAELAAVLSRKAADELGEIKQELQQLAEQSGIEDSLRVKPSEAESLAKRQSTLNEEVELAAEMLARAARHQERLGNPEQAETLDRAAGEVGQIATGSLDEAAKDLAAAAQDARQSSTAGKSMTRANQDLAGQAEKLADMIAKQNAANEPADSAPASGETSTAEKLARTLDELDQAVNSDSMPQQSQQAGDAQGQPGEQGENGQPSESEQAQTAGEASKTLADAAQSQAQRAAKQRESQTSAQQPGEGDGKPSDDPGEPSMPGTQSGNGRMPGGGQVDTDGIRRLGDDWGALREQRTDDAVEERSAPIAPGYRREIEAYFRAIAERAAKQ